MLQCSNSTTIILIMSYEFNTSGHSCPSLKYFLRYVLLFLPKSLNVPRDLSFKQRSYQPSKADINSKWVIAYINPIMTVLIICEPYREALADKRYYRFISVYRFTSRDTFVHWATLTLQVFCSEHISLINVIRLNELIEITLP